MIPPRDDYVLVIRRIPRECAIELKTLVKLVEADLALCAPLVGHDPLERPLFGWLREGVESFVTGTLREQGYINVVVGHSVSYVALTEQTKEELDAQPWVKQRIEDLPLSPKGLLEARGSRMNDLRKNMAGKLVAMPHAQRIDLMRALVFRRLDDGVKLTRPQLELGLRYDDEEIQKYWKGWKVDEFLGMPYFEFHAKYLVEPGFVKEEPVPGKKYSSAEQTQAGRDWLKTLDEDFAWFIETMPMSTRGLFDNYRDEPETMLNMSPEELAGSMMGDNEKKIMGTFDPKKLLSGQGFKPTKDEDEEPDEIQDPGFKLVIQEPEDGASDDESDGDEEAPDELS